MLILGSIRLRHCAVYFIPTRVSKTSLDFQFVFVSGNTTQTTALLLKTLAGVSVVDIQQCSAADSSLIQ